MLSGLLAIVLMAQAAPEPVRPDGACTVARMTAADGGAMLDVVLAGEELSPERPAVARMMTQVEACVRERGWNEEQHVFEAAAASAAVLRTTAEQRLVAADIDPTVIETWFAALSAEVRASRTAPPEVREQLRARLAAAGIPAERIQQNMRLIGVYVGTLAVSQSVREGRLPEG